MILQTCVLENYFESFYVPADVPIAFCLQAVLAVSTGRSMLDGLFVGLRGIAKRSI